MSRLLTEEQQRELVAAYKNGSTLASLAKQYHVSWLIIRRAITDTGTPIRSKEEASRLRWPQLSANKIEARKRAVRKAALARKQATPGPAVAPIGKLMSAPIKSPLK